MKYKQRKKIKLNVRSGNSVILINERLSNLSEYVPSRNLVIITDSIVRKYYGTEFPDSNVIEIGRGEEVKNLETVKYIYEELINIGIDRSSFIAGIGGGVVCDITGFIASTYLRGIRFGFVPSTLVAQVDAAIGGKNGVNLNGYKNIVGSINQPEFVICDTHLLETLPERELLCGFAEIVKSACIKNAELFSYLEENYNKALKLENETITKLIYETALIKSFIVEKDEKEKNERRLLNFGHTFGHAIEMNAKILHGEAVSIGMIIAAVISEKKGLLSSIELNRIEALIKNLKLPAEYRLNIKEIINLILKDKKIEKDKIYFALLNGIGNGVIDKISVTELRKLIPDRFIMDFSEYF